MCDKEAVKLPRKFKKWIKKTTPSWVTSKEWLEWYLFPRRIDVRAMEVCLFYPRIATSSELFSWYKEHYPDDKLAQHFSKQNLHKWDKFNYHEIRR